MAKEKICGIYKVTNKLNGNCYIGQSVDIHKRFNAHKSLRKKGASALIDEMSSYGKESFLFEVFEECERELLNEREIFWIEKLNCISPNGYNLNSGGSCPTFVHESTRRKQSIAKIGKKQSKESIEARMKKLIPILRSKEYREKKANFLRGKKQPRELVEKRAAAQKGKIVTEEQRINIARAHMNGKAIRCSNGNLFLSTKEAALFYGMHTDSVLRVCNGRCKQAKGVVFKYEPIINNGQYSIPV